MQLKILGRQRIKQTFFKVAVPDLRREGAAKQYLSSFKLGGLQAASACKPANFEYAVGRMHTRCMCT